MKKIAIATAFALVAGAASAAEFGVQGVYDNHPTNGGFGVSVGQHFGDFSATGGFVRTPNNNVNNYTVIGAYDFAKIGNATFSAKAGGAYIDQPKGSKDGYAALVGAGVTIPVTKEVAATIDYRYQAGQDKVKNLDGSQVLVGAQYKF